MVLGDEHPQQFLAHVRDCSSTNGTDVLDCRKALVVDVAVKSWGDEFILWPKKNERQENVYHPSLRISSSCLSTKSIFSFFSCVALVPSRVEIRHASQFKHSQ